MLPTDAQERKDIPIYSGFVCYFPDAIAEVAKVSKRGNDQHNPGTPLHWDRSKSTDELDSMMRHVIDSANPDAELDELIGEAAARTWRSLADLQKLCEERVAEEKSVVGLHKLATAAQKFKQAKRMVDGLAVQDIVDRNELARLVDCETEQDILDRNENSKSQKLDEPNYAERRAPDHFAHLVSRGTLVLNATPAEKLVVTESVCALDEYEEPQCES